MNGWVIIDKNEGCTSNFITGRIKRLTHSKAGHGGTLDPFATGILPIALGQANRLIPFLFNETKTYRCTIQFGVQKDTDDWTGTVMATTTQIPLLPDIQNALSIFTGRFPQIPSLFCAAKVNGQRAYNLARQGVPVELAPRNVYVKELKILHYEAPLLQLQIECGTGFYVRALARDLAQHLGSLGHLVQLRRLQVGPFQERHSHLLDIFQEKFYKEGSKSSLILPFDFCVANYLELLELDEAEKNHLWCGRFIPCSFEKKGFLGCLFQGQLVAICRALEGKLFPYRCFLGDK